MIGATHVFWKLGKRSQTDQQPKRRGRTDLEPSEAGQPIGGTCDGRYKKSMGRSACPGVIIKSWGRGRVPRATQLLPGCSESWHAQACRCWDHHGCSPGGWPHCWWDAGRLGSGWAKDGARRIFLGVYKSARKTAIFTLRCHSQGPTQDQLLADFDSLSWNLGSPSPNWDTGTLGFWCFSLSLSFFFLASLLIPMQPFPY